MNTINLILKQFIIDEFLSIHGQNSLEANYPLFEEGIIDSLGLLILTNFIEEKFGFKFQPEEIVFENFQTLDTMTALVDQKIQERTPK